MHGVELWGKRVLRLPRCTANGMAETELGRDSRSGKAMWMAVKYWQRVMLMDIQDLVL
jgi:hypothetical protein